MSSPDHVLLVADIAASGLSARQYAERIVRRNERTVRRWVSGRSPIPAEVLAYLVEQDRKRWQKAGRP